MDGFGLSDAVDGNAIKAAKTPILDKLFAENAHTSLSASGLDVGLPDGQMGNSEVGHTNIGGGRVVFQDLPRISKAIEDGSFYENKAYNAAMDACLAQGSALHLLGLLSDGGVHSHITHLFALLELARRKGLKKVYIHAFLDGRDVPPSSGKHYVQMLVDECARLGVGKIATVQGRYYAMDRDKRWDRVEAAYDAMVYGSGNACEDPVKAVEDSYAAGITDEFVVPVVCDSEGTISDHDSVIFCNYRPDQTLKNCLGEYLSKLDLTQLRIAETEKYAHVTFFFNGGCETVFPGEDRVLVPSPKVATYDLQPEMSAAEVTEQVVDRIRSGEYDVIILNFANCDMVGHTGVFKAAVKAVETVDTCVGEVVRATAEMGGISMITADHGNVETMLDETGAPHTAHTTNPVPFIVVGAATKLRSGGRLADIAPTMLDLMGIEKPAEMDGETLITN